MSTMEWLAVSACCLSSCGYNSVSAPTASDAAVRDDVDADRPTLSNARIGTGRDGWIAVDDGATLPVIHGPQGGYHLLVRTAFPAISMPVMIRWSLTDPSDESAIWAQAASLRDGESGLRRSPQGWESDRAELLVFRDNRQVPGLYGRHATLRVWVQAADGELVVSPRVSIQLVAGI